MGKIQQNFMDDIYGDKTYKQFKKGLSDGDHRDILLGINGYSIADRTHPVNQDVSLTMVYLHTLVAHSDANSNALAKGMNSIDITAQNIVLVLSYIHFYLIYAQDNKLLTLDVRKMWEKCKDSDHYDAKKKVIENISSKILPLLPEKKKQEGKKINTLEDAIRFFILAMIVKVKRPQTFYTLSNFFNYKLGLFQNLKPIVDSLEKEGEIEYLNDSYAFKGTDKGIDNLSKVDMKHIVRMLTPTEDKLSFYEEFTQLIS